MIEKFLLWDDIAGALRQICKNVECSVAEANLQTLASEHPFSAGKLERAEPQASESTPLHVDTQNQEAAYYLLKIID
jgi:hypothetical protein